jgi:hypothetical protein
MRPAHNSQPTKNRRRGGAEPSRTAASAGRWRTELEQRTTPQRLTRCEEVRRPPRRLAPRRQVSIPPSALLSLNVATAPHLPRAGHRLTGTAAATERERGGACVLVRAVVEDWWCRGGLGSWT